MGKGEGGVAKVETIWFPLPFISSHGGEGSFYERFQKMLEKNSQIENVRI
jgi:hypothetical protein